ncbi:unnamed protein product [Eruca vesicaria subsp. sativa]|uniref:Uncharacterized protein n=1 Tax=Eruca vesicaria subsp. sativa TaxID=29727 RepID=A0ABC8JZD1_ERUVS|nr:unnamed protein product [Eruca vesicaria subsp. sativa]
MEPPAATAAAAAYGNRRDAAAVKGFSNDSAADQTNDYQIKIKAFQTPMVRRLGTGVSAIQNHVGREEWLAINFTQLNRR